MNLTITQMINEIIRVNPKYERSLLYRKTKDEIEKIYRKVKRKKG